MRVHLFMDAARRWLTCAVAASGASLAQAGGVYWSVDINVPIERHGRVGTVVSNVPGGVVRGGPAVVVVPAPVVVKTVASRPDHREVIVVPVGHGHGRSDWRPRHRHVIHHHYVHDHPGEYRRGWRADRRDEWRDEWRDHRRDHREDRRERDWR